MADPRDPLIAAWLSTLKPADELMMRYAIRSEFPQVLIDPAFDDRIDTLRGQLKLSEDGLAKILVRAGQTQKHIATMINAISETMLRRC
jgi:hypothetical protein